MVRKLFPLILLIIYLLILPNLEAQNTAIIDPLPFQDNTNHWYSISDKHNIINALPNQLRYKPSEIKKIADNLLLFQKNNGGWPKNYDFFAILTQDQLKAVLNAKNQMNSTFDNGSTYTQISALALAYYYTNEIKYRDACIKGLEFILKAQYTNGGWPQYYPIEKNNYSSHITFNDGVITGIMVLLKDIIDKKYQYSFIDLKLRNRIYYAYNKGLECVLKTQIIEDGKLTAWCQQHDEISLKPAWARKFEPPCICTKESAELVLFLMSIKNPGIKVQDAIHGAVSWFESVKIYNTRIKTISAPQVQTPYKISTHDKVVIIDSTAPPIWTRYYELHTQRPMFCNRDSKVVYSLAEVNRERRDGYGWYNYAPEEVLKKYPIWKNKISKSKEK